MIVGPRLPKSPVAFLEISAQRRVSFAPMGNSRLLKNVEEQPRLPLPAHRCRSDQLIPVRSGKTIYVRFDLNDYSINLSDQY